MPAGMPHQVENEEGIAAKIAFDFISPYSLQRIWDNEVARRRTIQGSVPGLTGVGHVFEDTLYLEAVVWFTILACARAL